MTNKRLLVVEDDPRSLYAFRAVLQARGFEVVGCDSAEAALDLDGQLFDAAIIDVRLPQMQGPEFALRLRQNHPSTRIIFVTAYNGIDTLKKSVDGCTVLLKPIDMDTLLRLL